MLSGVTTLQAKPKYRIEIWEHNGTTYYLPQQKVWYRTNYFALPFKIWQPASYPFQNRYQAEEIINNWKYSYKENKIHRKSKYFVIE